MMPAEARRQAPAAATAAASEKSSERAFLDTYCVGCHNARLKSGDLQLDSFDVGHVLEHAETGEKIILRLRAGMMPPSGARRPDAKALNTFIKSLESSLDSAEPKPPSPGLHRNQPQRVRERRPRPARPRGRHNGAVAAR
jgi:mono/diheme cytochrome c family protein